MIALYALYYDDERTNGGANQTYPLYIPQGMDPIYLAPEYDKRTCVVSSAKLTLEDNKPGSLVVTIPSTNPYVDKIKLYHWGFHVVEYVFDGSEEKSHKIIWSGRAISSEEDIYGNVIFTCEGTLACLGDIVQDGFRIEASASYESDNESDFNVTVLGGPDALLRHYFDVLVRNYKWSYSGAYDNPMGATYNEYMKIPPTAGSVDLVNCIGSYGFSYNERIQAAGFGINNRRQPQFAGGKCQGTPGFMRYQSGSEDRPSYWELQSETQITESILDRIYRELVDTEEGHVFITVGGMTDNNPGDVLTAQINYLPKDYITTNEPSISYGENMLTLTKRIEIDKPITAIIPRGMTATEPDVLIQRYENEKPRKEYKDITRYIGISTYDSDKIESPYRVQGVHVLNTDLVKKYGFIDQIVDFPDISDSQELAEAAVDWLKKYNFESISIDTSAVDLGRVHGTNVEPMHLLDKVHVMSKDGAIDMVVPIVKMDIDLLNPVSTQVTLNKTETVMLSNTVRTEKKKQEDTGYQTTATRDLIGKLDSKSIIPDLDEQLAPYLYENGENTGIIKRTKDTPQWIPENGVVYDYNTLNTTTENRFINTPMAAETMWTGLLPIRDSWLLNLSTNYATEKAVVNDDPGVDPNKIFPGLDTLGESLSQSKPIIGKCFYFDTSINATPCYGCPVVYIGPVNGSMYLMTLYSYYTSSNNYQPFTYSLKNKGIAIPSRSYLVENGVVKSYAPSSISEWYYYRHGAISDPPRGDWAIYEMENTIKAGLFVTIDVKRMRAWVTFGLDEWFTTITPGRMTKSDFSAMTGVTPTEDIPIEAAEAITLSSDMRIYNLPKMPVSPGRFYIFKPNTQYEGAVLNILKKINGDYGNTPNSEFRW